MTLSLQAQVEREFVVVEIATGTWCSWCPGAADGADQMHANGLDVAIIENHNSDAFAYTGSNARNTYYAVGGYPTARFDGVGVFEGGDQCPPPFNTYNSYLPKYNQRKAIQSPFTMDLQFSHTGATEYQVTVDIEKVGTVTTDDLKLHVVVTESHIATTWFCMDECNFVNRIMVPNQNGTALDFSGGNQVTVNLTFNVGSSWAIENCEMVAFIQDLSSKEIHQAAMKSMAAPEHDLDAQLAALSNVPEGNCSGTITPEVTIKNWGAQILTSLTLNCQVNQGEILTEEWYGNLAFLEEETMILSTMTFTSEDENEMLIYGTNPNGNPDENTLNDTLTATFGAAFQADFYKIALLFKTDATPQQNTYEVVNAEGTVFYTGGPYEEANKIYRDTFELFTSDCYKFIMHDEGCDGLSGSFYNLREAVSGGATIFSGGEFGCTETTEFDLTWVGLDEGLTGSDEVRIYPNPFSKQTELRLNLDQSEQVEVEVYNLVGKLVFTSDLGILPAGEHLINLFAGQVSPGLNVVRVKAGEKIFTQKLVLER
jgi:hypothetical protein